MSDPTLETYALRGLLQAAGIDGRVTLIDNQYWPKDPSFDKVRTPWLRVETAAGRIVIGWRKRVICIDWKGSGFKVSGAEIVQDEKTTHDGHMCHAWSYAEAEACLTRLRATFPEPPVPSESDEARAAELFPCSETRAQNPHFWTLQHARRATWLDGLAAGRAERDARTGEQHP